ncbi:hypothetical protein Dimus_012526 [Dionaea muscipula]
MGQKILDEATGNMTQLCREIVQVNVKCSSIVDRISALRRFFRFLLDRVLVCSGITRRGGQYRRLLQRQPSSPPKLPADVESAGGDHDAGHHRRGDGAGAEYETEDSDLVSLKISLLGDSQIGKTSFVVKYVGNEQDKTWLEMNGLNLMVKTLFVQGARISFRIWDVGGDRGSFDHVPISCKDADAILFMFDLTSRSTLQSVIGWYNEARKWNKTAIPVLIGTKFDDFVRFPLDLQCTVITQARSYAKAMKATLFFSSATHNINVNKIFKFIAARLFNLPWTVQRNLTIGEPIIDF